MIWHVLRVLKKVRGGGGEYKEQGWNEECVETVLLMGRHVGCGPSHQAPPRAMLHKLAAVFVRGMLCAMDEMEGILRVPCPCLPTRDRCSVLRWRAATTGCRSWTARTSTQPIHGVGSATGNDKSRRGQSSADPNLFEFDCWCVAQRYVCREPSIRSQGPSLKPATLGKIGKTPSVSASLCVSHKESRLGFSDGGSGHGGLGGSF